MGRETGKPDKQFTVFLNMKGTLKGAKARKLIVLVSEAKNIRGLDIGGTSDPFVVIEFQNQRFSTVHLPATLNPKWEDKIYLYVLSPALILSSKTFSPLPCGSRNFERDKISNRRIV